MAGMFSVQGREERAEPRHVLVSLMVNCGSTLWWVSTQECYTPLPVLPASPLKFFCSWVETWTAAMGPCLEDPRLCSALRLLGLTGLLGELSVGSLKGGHLGGMGIVRIPRCWERALVLMFLGPERGKRVCYRLPAQRG